MITTASNQLFRTYPASPSPDMLGLSVFRRPESGAAPHCFAAGTRIATVRGEVEVENLQVGDVVQTMDSGLKPIIWIGRNTVAGSGEFAPIRFKADAIGNVRDLVVSPRHRILMRGWQAAADMGLAEVLVPAIHLVDGDRIIIDQVAEVQYFHILFDQHEVIFSDGAATESFFPGAQVLEGDAALRRELRALFPELFDGKTCSFLNTARKAVTYDDAAQLRAA